MNRTGYWTRDRIDRLALWGRLIMWHLLAVFATVGAYYAMFKFFMYLE